MGTSLQGRKDPQESGRYRQASRAPSTRGRAGPRTKRGGHHMTDQQTEARVRAAVARATGRDVAAAPVRRLAGHASLRSYWRVGTYPGSLVVMVTPPGAKPEEVTQGG